MIPTNMGGEATFRDENMSLNGQAQNYQQPAYNHLTESEKNIPQSAVSGHSDALGYGTFQPDQIKPATQQQMLNQ